MKPLTAVSVLLAVVGLSACGAAPVVAARTVVESECKQQVPDRPAMATDALPQDAGVDAYVQAAKAELDTREGYEVDMRAALVACTTPLQKATPK